MATAGTFRMKLSGRQNLWAGFMFLGFGAILALGSGRYSIGTLDEMGPGFLPLCVGILLGGTGTILIGRSLLAGNDTPVDLYLFPIILIGMAICAFAWLFQYLGLAIAIFGLTVFTARASPHFRLHEAVLLGLLLGALSVALFVYGLGLPFKTWPSVRL
jgi:hypothetical protein